MRRVDMDWNWKTGARLYPFAGRSATVQVLSGRRKA